MQLAAPLIPEYVLSQSIIKSTKNGIKNITIAAIPLFIALEIAFGIASLSFYITTCPKSTAIKTINNIGTTILTTLSTISITLFKSSSIKPSQVF